MGWVEEKEKEDMFNKHCKKVALIMALSMMTSVTAFAAKKEFNFNVVVERISKYSAENPKSDNEGYAYVTVEKANLKNDSAVEYAVSNIDRTAERDLFPPAPEFCTSSQSRQVQRRHNN